MTRFLNPTSLTLLALTLAAAASLWLALGPVYQGVSVTAIPVAPGSSRPPEAPFSEHHTSFSASLVAMNGLRVVPLLVLPVAFIFLGLTCALVWPQRKQGRIALWGLALLLLAFCAVGIVSIGIFYLPSALALLTAAITSGRKKRFQN